MTRLKTVHAVYKNGTLIFANPELAPRDGAEVVITFLEEFQTEGISGVDPIQSLRFLQREGYIDFIP